MSGGYLWNHLIHLQTRISQTEPQFTLLSVQKDKRQKVDVCSSINLPTQRNLNDSQNSEDKKSKLKIRTVFNYLSNKCRSELESEFRLHERKEGDENCNYHRIHLEEMPKKCFKDHTEYQE